VLSGTGKALVCAVGINTQVCNMLEILDIEKEPTQM